MYGQTNVIEPELHSDINFEYTLSKNFMGHNGKVYVSADDRVHGLELWVFNRNMNSMRMVKDINPNGDSDPLIVSNELDHQLLFIAKDENGTALWSTDGTPEGTVKLKELQFEIANWNGVLKESDKQFIKYNNEVYFSASEPKMFDEELWKTDGTPEGTVLIKDIYTDKSSRPYNLQLLKDKLYFQVFNGLNDTPDIWSTDGTKENTIKLLDFATIVPNSFFYSKDVHEHIFIIDTSNQKNVLWSTNGSIEGTIQLINNSDGLKLNLSPASLLGGKLYFSGRFTSGELGLFVSDGSLDGTRQVNTISLDPNSELSLMSNKGTEEQNLYFSLVEEGNYSLWISNGTDKNTKKIAESLKNINVRMSAQSGLKTFFVATDDEHGDELWVSDGTEQGTHLVKDIVDGTKGSGLWFSSIIIEGKVLFYVDDENGVASTWISDGTENGTFKLNPGLNDLTHMSFYTNQYNNMLLFAEESVADTVRMWQTNMTKQGTSIIMPKNQTSSYHVNPIQFFQIELFNNIYFFADYYGEGQQLYRIPNTISSVEDTPQPELMTVYPNPAKDYIQLELSKPMQLSIINSTGAKVKDYGMVAGGKLNVAELHSGVYFVVDELGNNIAKFLKE